MTDKKHCFWRAASDCRGGDSFTIYTINFSTNGSNKIFVDKSYEGSRAESSIYVVKIT